MNADFQIENFESKSDERGVGKHFTNFGLKFSNKHSVNLKGETHEPHFKNTLSESDKRLLAFAFFCSTLTHDTNLNQKILVFDDPISSFDDERKLASIGILADFECAQKIILTHEKSFMHDILLEYKFEKAKVLEIKYFAPEKTSKIILSQKEVFLENEIEKKIKRLKKMLNDENFLDYEKDCRTILEFFFTIKHAEELKEKIQQRKGIRTFSEEIFKDNELQKTKICKTLQLFKYSTS